MKPPEFLPSPSRQILFKLIKLRDDVEHDLELQEFIKNANNEYWPWEIFKYKKVSKLNFDSKDLWYYLKFFTRNKTKIFKEIKDVKKESFGYVLTDKIQEYLHVLDKTLSSNILAQKPFSLDAQLRQEQEEWKAKKIINSLIEEAITSAQIEGAATSRRRAIELIKSGKKPRTIDEKMILNNYSTMKIIKEAFINKPLSIEMIKEIQIILTKDTLSNENDVGNFRRDVDENDIVRVYDSADNSVLFTPPPAKEIESRLQQLCDFINNDKEFIHPIIKGILLHFYVAYIHPFYDGNGRTARGLFYWYVLKNNLELFEYISVSEYIKKRLPSYLKAFLYTELDNNDLTYFIMFNLRIILLAMRDISKYIDNKMTNYFVLKEKVKNIKGLNIRQLDLLNHALKHPDQRYTIHSHAVSNNISWATSRRDLLDLANAGLLEKKLMGKELYFFVPGDLNKKIEA